MRKEPGAANKQDAKALKAGHSITRASAAEYLTFVAAAGQGGVEALYADENVWLTQKMLAQLYDVNVRTVNEHLRKIFSDRELSEDSVIRKFRITASDGKTYDTQHYGLTAIIAVGYKVNSERAVQFRKELAAPSVWHDGPGQRQAGRGPGHPDHTHWIEQVLSMQVAERASQHRFSYGDEVIAFSLRRQPSRTVARVAIHVEPDARVLVDAPDAAPLADVLAAVKKRARWISQHVEAAKARRAHVLPREYVSGESLHYLGRRYRLKVIVDADAAVEARMRGAFITVTAPERAPSTIRSALDAWYRQRARELLANRIAAVAAPLRWVKQLPPTRLQFMTVQWGSCSPSGRITLNPLLVKAPRECIDYVLLHELCHLLHHNHSPQFYRALDRHMPDWRAVKDRLDNMAEQMFRD